MLYREMIPIEPRVNITNVAPTKKERQKGTKIQDFCPRLLILFYQSACFKIKVSTYLYHESTIIKSNTITVTTKSIVFSIHKGSNSPF